MNTVPITIRVPNNELNIIDAYAKEIGVSRTTVFRNFITDTAQAIRRSQLKKKLTDASKKISQHNMNENVQLENTLSDGLND